VRIRLRTLSSGRNTTEGYSKACVSYSSGLKEVRRGILIEAQKERKDQRTCGLEIVQAWSLSDYELLDHQRRREKEKVNGEGGMNFTTQKALSGPTENHETKANLRKCSDSRGGLGERRHIAKDKKFSKSYDLQR